MSRNQPIALSHASQKVPIRPAGKCAKAISGFELSISVINLSRAPGATKITRHAITRYIQALSCLRSHRRCERLQPRLGRTRLLERERKRGRSVPFAPGEPFLRGVGAR